MLNFYWLLNCPIWPVRLQMFVIGQVKSDSLDLKQPIKAEIRAVNSLSCSSILLLTQLEIIIVPSYIIVVIYALINAFYIWTYLTFCSPAVWVIQTVITFTVPPPPLHHPPPRSLLEKLANEMNNVPIKSKPQNPPTPLLPGQTQDI